MNKLVQVIFAIICIIAAVEALSFTQGNRVQSYPTTSWNAEVSMATTSHAAATTTLCCCPQLQKDRVLLSHFKAAEVCRSPNGRLMAISVHSYGWRRQTIYICKGNLVSRPIYTEAGIIKSFDGNTINLRGNTKLITIDVTKLRNLFNPLAHARGFVF